MDLGLSGRTAVVAAASRGLGRASALALAREGANVAICARDGEELEAAAAEIRADSGAEVLAVPADLTDPEAIAGVVAAAVERFGGLHVLVHNSGGPPVGRFGDIDDEQWHLGFELVTMSFVRFVRAAVPHMRAGGWGRIVGIQSSSVKQPVAGIDISSGTRPGVAGLAKALMGELAGDGITINLVLPGMFATSRIHPGLVSADPQERRAAEEQLAPVAERIPVGPLGDPIELGELVAFLASERAGYITGAVCQIDGGIIASNV